MENVNTLTRNELGQFVKGSGLYDITGRVFGRLTVLRFAGMGKRRESRWECLCTCGKIKVIIKNSLVGGQTTSCGCYNKEVISGVKKFNFWTFCDEGCYTELKHGRCWIDPEDWPKVKNYHLLSRKGDSNTTAYVDVCINADKIINLHRFLLCPTKQQLIDHKDHNGLNNRRYNIRIATYSENSCNSFRVKPPKTGFRGVSFLQRSPKDVLYYDAAIRKDGVRYRKLFKTLDEAVIWRDEMAKKLHGEFAVFNNKAA